MLVRTQEGAKGASIPKKDVQKPLRLPRSDASGLMQRPAGVDQPARLRNFPK